MRYVKIVVPLLLVGFFLSLYVPWRIEDGAKFRTEGPGALMGIDGFVGIHWIPNKFEWRSLNARAGGIVVVRDKDAIAKVVVLLEPVYGKWDRRNFPLKDVSSLVFCGKSPWERILVRFTGDYVICGRYSRRLPVDTVLQIRALLVTNGKIVDERD